MRCQPKHLHGSDSGSMLAVKASEEDITAIVSEIDDIYFSNFNSNNQTILGGSTTAIDLAVNRLKEAGFKAVLLPVSAAFHTRFVEHARLPFAQCVEAQTIKNPSIPVSSNSTGLLYPNDIKSIKSILKEHIVNPVLFKKQIENLYASGVRTFIELGPKSILQNLIQDILPSDDIYVISMNASPAKDDDLQFRQALVQLCVLGYPLTHF